MEIFVYFNRFNRYSRKNVLILHKKNLCNKLKMSSYFLPTNILKATILKVQSGDLLGAP